MARASALPAAGMMTQPPILLHDFQSQRPAHHLGQDAILDWIVAAHVQSEMTRRLPAEDEEARDALSRKFRKQATRFGCGADRIGFRDSALEDFTHRDWERMRIFPLTRLPSGQACGERSLFYQEACGLAFERFYGEADAPPPVLIHVTCTGYVSPSGAQRLVAARGWGRATEVVHAYHMGCYAALPAIRLAAGFLANGKARVDIVHTEFCTLHMDPGEHMPESWVVQTLFADGAVRYAVSRGGSAAPQGLELIGFQEEVLPDTDADMTWMVSDHGMRMTLSRRVPERIRAHLDGFLDRLASGAGMTAASLRESARFAIHPGGPRIIDEVAGHLGLRAEQAEASNAVLRGHGNMSSATLPHVWKALLEDGAVRPGEWIVSLAFGPGLTISGGLLRKTG